MWSVADFVVRLRPDGSREWERPVSGVRVNDVGQITQTSDAGFELLCANDKRYKAEDSVRF